MFSNTLLADFTSTNNSDSILTISVVFLPNARLGVAASAPRLTHSTAFGFFTFFNNLKDNVHNTNKI